MFETQWGVFEQRKEKYDLQLKIMRKKLKCLAQSKYQAAVCIVIKGYLCLSQARTQYTVS